VCCRSTRKRVRHEALMKAVREERQGLGKVAVSRR
jgi:hypothetical protein